MAKRTEAEAHFIPAGSKRESLEHWKILRGRPDVKLSNGRIALHRPMKNGATEVYFADNDNMSELEWQEYCGIIAARSTGIFQTSFGFRLNAPGWERRK